ncbi:MAG: winged helix domain-containing protein, partial [Pollutimonas bauzanensis]
PAALPDSLVEAAVKAIAKIRYDKTLAARFLGQWLTDIPPNAYFEPSSEDLDLSAGLPVSGKLALDRCSRLMYRDRELFINGEVAAIPASPRLRLLADERELACASQAAARLKEEERRVLTQWLQEGWLHYIPD